VSSRVAIVRRTIVGVLINCAQTAAEALVTMTLDYAAETLAAHDVERAATSELLQSVLRSP
jgi:hypothetical protein